MARAMASLALYVLFMMVVVTEGGPQKAKQVKCQDKNYSTCYHIKKLCPSDCLRTCVVDCATCEPVCIAPPPPPPSPPPPPPRIKGKRSPPPPPTPVPIFPPPPTPIINVTPSPPPPPPTPVPIFPPPPTPINVTPSPPPPTPVPIFPPPPTPINVTPTPSSPPPPPPDSTEVASQGRARCRNKNYPSCYGIAMNCTSDCPRQCEVDCVTCSPVCGRSPSPTPVCVRK